MRLIAVLLLTLMGSFPAFGGTLHEHLDLGETTAVHFAKRMGICDTDNLKWETIAGIPTNINGQKVPEELYTEKQLHKILQVRELELMINEGEKEMRQLQTEEKPAPKIKDMRVVPSPPRSVEVDTTVY